MSNQQHYHQSEASAPKQSARGRLLSGAPNPVDVHVGNRLYRRRTLLGISQTKLADTVGVTFQQIQKYERGANRIAASRLWDLSQVLGCGISYFYEEMGEGIASVSPLHLRLVEPNCPATGNSESQNNERADTHEAGDLIRAFSSIKDRPIRRHICQLTKSLALSDEIEGSLKREPDDKHGRHGRG